ncbi:MAG: PTS system mannose/fructose/sorbose family transporter subunit IID [Anaerolineae bacterium]|jgi:PTS system mannose-specific IID component|nr:PTS system mannose/fructose/sorbose family transporter subunit IID [Anaerolineae bacterium]MDH7472620.1 PTS system mannose/fructose/sorbose family transporter subunit IID [Anaerolineae bacterium]
MKDKIALAMVVSLTLVLMGAGLHLVHAAPPMQDQPAIRMNLGMAVMVGILYYLAMSPWFADLGFAVLYRPLVAGTLVGIVMGRPLAGMLVGANINILYLGWISTGGSLPGDPGLAGYLGTALALSGGLDAKQALALAAPLGLLGSLTWALRMSTCSIFAHIADSYAARGNIRGVALANFVFPQPFLFVIHAVPVALATWLGSTAVAQALDWIAQNAGWVMQGLYVASGMLSALGIALNLRFLFRGSLFPYFFIGFLVASLAGGEINLLLSAIIGMCVAFLHVLFTAGELERVEAPAHVEARRRAGLLSKADVFKAWLLWLFFSHANYNWERMQGTGFAHSMTPIIRKLYKTPEDIRAALTRHLVFFNTQPDIGGVVHGVIIAMEEERAMGADISDDAINAVKTGLMGPMAGIGDTIQQGVVIPLSLAIGMDLALRGSFLGPVLFALLVAAFVWGVGWTVWYSGYRQGKAVVTNILQSGVLQRVMTGAGVLGNFVLGVLAVKFVKLSTPIKFVIGGTTFELQSVLDSLLPNLLPLLLVLVIWWLLEKKKMAATTVMVIVIAVAVLGSYPVFGEFGFF